MGHWVSEPRSLSRAGTLLGMPSASQGYRPFLEAEMGPGYREDSVAWSGDERGVDQSCSLICVCVFVLPAGKQSPVLNWQDCEVPRPQPHGLEPSSQCVAAQLYPLRQQSPASLPRPPASTAGAPAQ